MVRLDLRYTTLEAYGLKLQVLATEAHNALLHDNPVGALEKIATLEGALDALDLFKDVGWITRTIKLFQQEVGELRNQLQHQHFFQNELDDEAGTRLSEVGVSGTAIVLHADDTLLDHATNAKASVIGLFEMRLRGHQYRFVLLVTPAGPELVRAPLIFDLMADNSMTVVPEE